MPAGNSSSAAVSRTPRCIVVTGPSAPEKTHWLQRTLRQALATRPPQRCAVLMSDETAEEMQRFARTESPVFVRRLTLPCRCCPGRTDLPHALRVLAEESAADIIFVELPALAAATHLAEFGARPSWPREVVVCLDAAWAAARRADALSFFQFQLLAAADRVIDSAEVDGSVTCTNFRDPPRQHPPIRRLVRRVLLSPCRP